MRRAKTVLDANWNGEYTIPAAGLYPHQWNWDSGFIAIGYSHYRTERAVRELTHLFNAQWENGMVPQIVFDSKKLGSYFPEPDFWQSERSPSAPRGINTSGITMPPVHAFAALKVYENAKRSDAVRPFLEWLFPRLMKLHRYLYRERDPEGIGLVYIRHPWESGMDNSPMWDKVLSRIAPGTVNIPHYERLDLLSGVKADERPGDIDYDRFVYLVDLFRRHAYDESVIQKESPYLIYGPLFNSILSASNEALIKIADIIGREKKEIKLWHDQTKRAIQEKLYHKERGIFDFYDLVENRRLEVDTAAGFLPLFGGAATKAQASGLYDYLNSRSFCALHQGNCYTIPNYDVCKEDFERTNYWRGPLWININWMIMQGLRRYGYKQKADAIAKDILQLPMRFGFREYYDSFDGRGYGSNNFSWTAALFIDTAYETYLKTGEERLGKRIKKMLWKDVILNCGKEPSKTPSHIISQNMLAAIREIKSRYCTSCGNVSYDEIKSSGEYEEYGRVTASLRDFNLDLLKEENHRLAFWINIYNALVVDGIIRIGIKSSVKEFIGFFSKVKYVIGGYGFSLSDMEHGILRRNARPFERPLKCFGMFDSRKEYAVEKVDPRIHFALVCGSRSCAPIGFYTARHIDEELELASTHFVNSSEVIVMPEEKKLLMSMIFKWYETDFGGLTGVLDFIERYTVDDDKRAFLKSRPKDMKVDYLYYDWNLNR